MTGFRSAQEEERYAAYRAALPPDFCPLCDRDDEIVELFVHWKIMPNDFPYDRIAARHDMLVSRRHAVELDLTPEELAELREIKEVLLNGDGKYEYILEPKNRSIPSHFHLHLIVSKDW